MRNYLISSYRSVMDHRFNPFQYLDTASQFYFMTLLAWMWSMVFSLAFLSIFYFHWMWLGHLLVLGATFATIEVFKRAEASSKPAPLPADAKRRCVWQLESEA
ncbi:MAG: hypothetical protein KJP25_07900 [Gammaproteobacteria bacterium]|nr:hypothetical protein [Gammaproteobacteria bacterium]NNM11410.1 hypothetical protein [Pseudomonadales bacterium]